MFGDILKTLFAKIDGLEGTFWAERAFSVLLLAVALLYYILKKVIQELKVRVAAVSLDFNWFCVFCFAACRS